MKELPDTMTVHNGNRDPEHSQMKNHIIQHHTPSRRDQRNSQIFQSQLTTLHHRIRFVRLINKKIRSELHSSHHCQDQSAVKLSR